MINREIKSNGMLGDLIPPWFDFDLYEYEDDVKRMISGNKNYVACQTYWYNKGTVIEVFEPVEGPKEYGTDPESPNPKYRTCYYWDDNEYRNVLPCNYVRILPSSMRCTSPCGYDDISIFNIHIKIVLTKE